MTTKDAISEIVDLAAGNASGEFICATSSLEVHVYLQAGRVAWATDSKHPFAFAKYLQESARIDDDTFRQVIEDCRRDKLPLGETLVKWGLVSEEGVRDALRHQIRQAFDELLAAPTCHALFLDRGYSGYNPRLTFDVHEFLAASSSQVRDEPPQSRVSIEGRSGFARQLRESIDGLSWVEVLEGEALVDGDPAGANARTPLCVLRTSIHDGADFVAIRSAQGSLVGLGAAGERSLWCRLSADSPFGAAVSTLWTITSTGRRSNVSSVSRPGPVTHFAGDEHGPLTSEMRGFLERAPEVLAAVVLDAGDRSVPTVGFAVPEVEVDRCLTIARKRSECLSCQLWMGSDNRERSLDSVGFYLKTMVSGEGNLWCFGAELGVDPPETLWLFLHRGCSQGLGWAYLSTLYRALSHVPNRASA